jgi:hypothetical protein
MNQSSSLTTVNIRPGVNVYATYRRLSYKPWYAIAEFVDNSTQNYYDHRRELLRAFKSEKATSQLQVEISYDGENNSLTVLDNANGMEIEELTRALVLNKPPPDPSGRCEYGMGLKTAACWFGRTWTINTSRLGSPRALTATVHVPDLAGNTTEEIPVYGRYSPAETHFTRITIEGLYNPIRGRTAGRIRDQLASMYREDLRSQEVNILWNGETIAFEEPPILTEKLGEKVIRFWRKGISFEVPWDRHDQTLNVSGWVAIRIPASQRDAGFVLFRRRRVVVGGPGEGYKPVEIFGQGNTFRSQRLIGELHMDDWPITQAKDAFDWSGGLEDALIEHLKEVCQDYMEYAEGYRQATHRVTRTEMELASEVTQNMFSDQRFGSAVAQEVTFPYPPKTQEEEIADTEKLKAVSEGPLVYRLDVGTETWLFRLHWQDQLSDTHWMQVSYPQDDEIDIFLNMAHPFFIPHLGERRILELLQKFVLSLALAERLARQVSRDGLVAPGDFRNYMNRVLRRAGEITTENGV